MRFRSVLNRLNYLALGSALAFAVACGKDDDSGGGSGGKAGSAGSGGSSAGSGGSTAGSGGSMAGSGGSTAGSGGSGGSTGGAAGSGGAAGAAGSGGSSGGAAGAAGSGGGTADPFDGCLLDRSGVTFTMNRTDPAGMAQRVIIESIRFDNESMVIRNVGSTDITFDGNWVVSVGGSPMALSATLPNGFVLGAGKRVRIHLNASGTDDAINIYLGSFHSFWPVDMNGSREISISSATTQSSATIEAFLEWGGGASGSGDQTLQPEAVAAGIWPDIIFTPVIYIYWVPGDPDMSDHGVTARPDGDVNTNTDWFTAVPDTNGGRSCF